MNQNDDGEQGLRDIVRRHVHVAVRALVAICEDENVQASTRVAAANAVLDRAYGRPPQAVEVHGHRDVADLSDGELAAIIQSESHRGGARTVGKAAGKKRVRRVRRSRD